MAKGTQFHVIPRQQVAILKGQGYFIEAIHCNYSSLTNRKWGSYHPQNKARVNPKGARTDQGRR